MGISSGTPPDAIPPLTVSGSRLLGLKLGVPLRAVVEGPSENGWLLRVGGNRIEARSALSLVQGQRLTVVASRTSGSVFLRIIGETSGPETSAIRAQLGLPDDDVSAAVLRAAVRSGLGLRSDRVWAIYRLVDRLKRSGKSTTELSRFAGLMEAKGMDLDAELASLISGRTDSEAGAGGQGRQDSGGKEPTARAELVDMVRHAFRTAPAATHPLQLFNHLIGQGDHWLIVPLSAAIGTEMVSGSIRILVPRGRAIAGSGETFRYAVVALRDGEQERLFCLSPIGEQGRASRKESAAPTGGVEARLRNRMKELGYRMTVIDESDDIFDGFSWDVEGAIMKSVNSSA